VLRNAALLLTLLPFVSPPAAAQDEFELEDTVAIVVVDRDLVAHAAGGGARKLRLEVGERLIWQGSRGRIGFAVSDRRLLGFRAGTGWSQLALRVTESPTADPELSTRIALFVTSQRAIAFDGRWHEEGIGPQETLQTTSVGSAAALVVTRRRALALSPSSGRFVAAKLGIHETVETARTVASSAEITTSKRVLFFSGASWTEQKRTRY